MGTWKWLGVFAILQLTAGVTHAQQIDGGPWQQRDIGDVGIPGSAHENFDGDVLINGAGSDIWGTSDSFFFLYQPMEDGEIRSNPPSQDATNPHAKIGLMIRATLDPDSPHVVLDMQPDGSIEFMTRAAAGGQTTFIAGLPAGNQSWGYLTRGNGRVTAIVCANSDTCRTLGSVAFPSGRAYVGAIVTSHDPSVLNHGVFANPPSVSTVPSSWFSYDVGNVGLRGTAFYRADSGTFTVQGAGADIWGPSDAYHFVPHDMSGDGTIIVRVTGEDAANTFAKAGIIAVDTIFNDPNRATVIYSMRPNGFAEFMARPATGANMQFIAASFVPFPSWLKLQRFGNQFTAFWSTDGSAWNFTGSTNVAMPANIRAGLAVTSHDTTALNTATFDHVLVASGGSNDIDVGDTGAAGSASFSGNVLTVRGGGADIWGTEDAFNFFYQSLLDDGQMTVRVDSLENTNTFAKAGLMIRASTDPSSAYVILDVRPGGELEFMMRQSDGASTTFLGGAVWSFPADLKLSRSGSTVSAFVSSDGGATWNSVGPGGVHPDLPSDALLGLAVTSHQRGVLTTATFQNLAR
jgi:hypothetical protein